ncbi:MAG: hypothetical protein V4451_17025 [Pseudomonadota bacterium]
MNTTRFPPVNAPIHESTHMRSVSNTTEDGAKVVEVRISALSMHWQGQTLQVTHKLTASPGRRPPDRTAGRNMRSRR